MTGTDQDRAHAEVTRRQQVVGPIMGCSPPAVCRPSDRVPGLAQNVGTVGPLRCTVVPQCEGTTA